MSLDRCRLHIKNPRETRTRRGRQGGNPLSSPIDQELGFRSASFQQPSCQGTPSQRQPGSVANSVPHHNRPTFSQNEEKEYCRTGESTRCHMGQKRGRYVKNGLKTNTTQCADLAQPESRSAVFTVGRRENDNIAASSHTGLSCLGRLRSVKPIMKKPGHECLIEIRAVPSTEKKGRHQHHTKKKEGGEGRKKDPAGKHHHLQGEEGSHRLVRTRAA